MLYTLLEQELGGAAGKNLPASSACRACRSSVRCCGLFQAYLGGETKPRVGAQHVLNAEYFKRIDALNYTMLHDDGQHVDDMEQADVVLVGVSRTSKTPTSIYLANRGVKTANFPLVPGMPVPPKLETLAQPLVVGLDREPGADRADPPEPAARLCAPSTTPISISTARRWRRRSRRRASFAASTTGRSST